MNVYNMNNRYIGNANLQYELLQTGRMLLFKLLVRKEKNNINNYNIRVINF